MSAPELTCPVKQPVVVPGCEATLEIDNVSLPDKEYDTEGAQITVTGYSPSIPGYDFVSGYNIDPTGTMELCLRPLPAPHKKADVVVEYCKSGGNAIMHLKRDAKKGTFEFNVEITDKSTTTLLATYTFTFDGTVTGWDDVKYNSLQNIALATGNGSENKVSVDLAFTTLTVSFKSGDQFGTIESELNANFAILFPSNNPFSVALTQVSTSQNLPPVDQVTFAPKGGDWYPNLLALDCKLLFESTCLGMTNFTLANSGKKLTEILVEEGKVALGTILSYNMSILLANYDPGVVPAVETTLSSIAAAIQNELDDTFPGHGITVSANCADGSRDFLIYQDGEATLVTLDDSQFSKEAYKVSCTLPVCQGRLCPDIPNRKKGDRCNGEITTDTFHGNDAMLQNLYFCREDRKNPRIGDWCVQIRDNCLQFNQYTECRKFECMQKFEGSASTCAVSYTQLRDTSRRLGLQGIGVADSTWGFPNSDEPLQIALGSGSSYTGFIGVLATQEASARAKAQAINDTFTCPDLVIADTHAEYCYTDIDVAETKYSLLVNDVKVYDEVRVETLGQGPGPIEAEEFACQINLSTGQHGVIASWDANKRVLSLSAEDGRDIVVEQKSEMPGMGLTEVSDSNVVNQGKDLTTPGTGPVTLRGSLCINILYEPRIGGATKNAAVQATGFSNLVLPGTFPPK